MKMSLLAALAQLDPSNDNHWTGEGLPRLDTVKFMTGDSTVTREAVTQAAPGLTRATPLQGAQAPVSGGGTGEAQNVAPAPAQAPSQGDGNGASEQGDGGSGDDSDSEGGTVDQGQEADPELAAAQRAHDAALARKAEADREVAATGKALDVLLEAREAAGQAANAGSPFAAYLKAQTKLLQERGAKMQALRGVDLKSILPTRAPIDDALRRRNTRGTQRPTKL